MASERTEVETGAFAVETDAVKTLGRSYYEKLNSSTKAYEATGTHIQTLSKYSILSGIVSSMKTNRADTVASQNRSAANSLRLNEIAGLYETAENRILGVEEPKLPEPKENLSFFAVDAGAATLATGTVIKSALNPKTEYGDKLSIGSSYTTINTTNYTENHNGKYSKTIVKGEPADKRRVGKIAEVGAEVHASASATSKEFKQKYTSEELYALRAQGYANAGAGGYLYKDKNGKLIPAAGLCASVGGSIAVLGADQKFDIGSDMAGLHQGASASVGKVEGNAGIQCGYAKGGLLLEAQADAGAYAVEASAEASAKLLGIEVGAKGTFTVGVGAHAGASLKGGKLKLSLGLSLGIGFKLDINIDFSKITKCISTVVKGIKKVAKAIGNFFKKIW